VHGDGLDELSLCGPTRVTALQDGALRTFSVDPAEAGLDRCLPEALRGGDAGANARIARRVLGGDRGPARDVVLFNAAAALVVCGRAPDLRDGLAQAGRAVDDGAAARLLGRVVEATRA
jgi:anthranilate phosphoribosyltransferase